MEPESPGDLTMYLRELEDGDRSAVDRLLPLVYGDLRKVADNIFRQQRQDHTLQPTALVNEAYMRMVKASELAFDGRRHFLAVAAKAMRQILADHARKRFTDKRGGSRERVQLDELALGGSTLGDVDLVALDAALTKLQQVDARQARIVELRFLAGMTHADVAKVMNLGHSTVRLDWEMARAWLQREIESARAGDA